MTDYDNSNSGALFKNEYKEKDSQPDYKGPFTGPNGEEMEVAAWLRESKAGKKFMSVKVSPKRVAESAKQSAPGPDDLNDDIPF